MIRLGGPDPNRYNLCPLCGTVRVELASRPGLWVNHDRRHEAGAALTGHGFVTNLKQYAKLAGLTGIHLHQTRYTFARMVSEDSGSMLAAQDALGHKNVATTRVYVQRVGVKKTR
jgi:site-specific recombinase XerD